MLQARSALLALLLLVLYESLRAQPVMVGVNLAGAEFGDANLPGIYNVHYTYPTAAEIDYFVRKGMKVFRVPFRWERLQRALNAELDATELSRLDNIVHYATSAGAWVILDPHNYARYYGSVIGTANVPASAFADFWRRVAKHYQNNSKVIFGLMNEPNTMASELWRDDANIAIAAIRRSGATNLILVPGNAWTGAHSWTQNWYGTPNATTMLTVVDSLNNYAFEVHQYLDSNSSGTSATCSGTTVGTQRLQSFTNWLRQHGKRGFLGEFGVANNETCLAAMDNMLGHLDANSDVWLGWTWWAAGPWWGTYMFSLEPNPNGTDKPQMAVLQKHLGGATAVYTEREHYTPQNFSLRQNYPNPFNPATVISFQLATNSQVTLKVFDVNGEAVATLLEGEKVAGSYAVTFAPRNLAGGAYFYQLTVGEFSQTRKAIFVK